MILEIQKLETGYGKLRVLQRKPLHRRHVLLLAQQVFDKRRQR
ncbi:MAG: hypothetical protein Q8M76_13715 [Spirochaetaceae bacterium]|nr:hypothetical protein [Spirochaetaceae bacterium]